MVEINLNRREFTGNVITGKKELSQIIISSEKEFRKKYGKIEPNLEFRNLLDVLIGTYYSIEDQLNYVKNIHVPADTKTKLSKYFSLYNSSNAVLNLLNPKNTEVQKNKEPYISKKEIDDRCRFSFLSSILNKLENSVVMDH
ncbi:hypothetical protein KY312_04000, partial [Candidatus Woesearchaeota archaeon]|nr:hypothetical protein [Candidatus Woesearchaeota archaeon]